MPTPADDEGTPGAGAVHGLSTDDVSLDIREAWWLYLLACRDGRSYAGIARDVETRFARHAAGKGSKFTRANPPLRVLGAQPFATKSQALRAEHALKRLKPTAKRDWAAQWPWRAARCPPDTNEACGGLANGRSTADNPDPEMPGAFA